jgi:hypothetical protein
VKVRRLEAYDSCNQSDRFQWHRIEVIGMLDANILLVFEEHLFDRGLEEDVAEDPCWFTVLWSMILLRSDERTQDIKISLWWTDPKDKIRLFKQLAGEALIRETILCSGSKAELPSNMASDERLEAAPKRSDAIH